MKTLISTLLLTLLLSLGTATMRGQQTATPAGEEQKKEQKENEKKAFVLLDQVVNEAQMLRLAENRIRVQIGAADLLWAKDEGRARSLFSLAAEGVAEMMRNSENTEQQRRGPNQGRTGAQLRQELLLTVASHDAPLAYQLLAATRPLNPPATETNNTRRFDSEQNLEEALLAQVAALDPEFALRNAEQLLDKGEYSRSLTEVLKHLQNKDKDAAAKLEERIVKKLRSENMVANSNASGLALGLLQPGPRLTDDNSATPPNARQPILGASSYQDLMTVLIEAALKATPPAATNQPRQATRGRGGRSAVRVNTTPPTPQNQLTDAQNEQRNALRLLGGFRSLLPLVDQYVPGRAAAIRQKLSEMGMAENNRRPQPVSPTVYLQNTDSLLSAASAAPPAAQSRLYQVAALRALEEGNADRARQIANDHLDERRKQSVLQQIEFRQLAAKTEASRIDEVRNTLASLPSDSARVDMLVQLADSVRKKNPELAIELLDQAREFTSKRATGYEQFEMQLKVAAGFRDLPSGNGFEVLEPGVMQLNELLSAAAVLSGFEVNVFREGEMPLQGGSRLGDIVRRYGQEIGRLGRADSQRAEMLASRFQFAEPRIVARLALVRSLLGIESSPGRNNPRRMGFFTMDGVR